MINSLQGVINAMVGAGFTLATGVGGIGRTVTYQRWTTPVYDPGTGEVNPGSATEYTLPAILIGYTAREVLPDVILQTDQKALVRKADLAVTPQAQDILVIDAVPWRVVQIQDDASQTTWILQIRRASSEGAV